MFCSVLFKISMKYCERPELSDLSHQLTQLVADIEVTVSIELYTTKPASSDKRLIRTLDQQLADAGFVLESPISFTEAHLLSPPTSVDSGFKPRRSSMKRRAFSSPAGAGTPFGPLADVGNMKQYAYLIAVLNASDPDRDFSALQPTSFRRRLGDSLQALNQTLTDLGLQVPQRLWPVIEEEISPSECKVYSLNLPQQYIQDDDTGVFGSQMFFFFNKRRKRVLFISMVSRSARNQVEDFDYIHNHSDTRVEHPVIGELEF